MYPVYPVYGNTLSKKSKGPVEFTRRYRGRSSGTGKKKKKVLDHRRKKVVSIVTCFKPG